MVTDTVPSPQPIAGRRGGRESPTCASPGRARAPKAFTARGPKEVGGLCFLLARGGTLIGAPRLGRDRPLDLLLPGPKTNDPVPDGHGAFSGPRGRRLLRNEGLSLSMAAGHSRGGNSWGRKPRRTQASRRRSRRGPRPSGRCPLGHHDRLSRGAPSMTPRTRTAILKGVLAVAAAVYAALAPARAPGGRAGRGRQGRWPPT